MSLNPQFVHDFLRALHTGSTSTSTAASTVVPSCADVANAAGAMAVAENVMRAQLAGLPDEHLRRLQNEVQREYTRRNLHLRR